MMGSCQTVPVKESAGPRRDGAEPLGRISICVSSVLQILTANPDCESCQPSRPRLIEAMNGREMV
jgi:hypothetical protein